MSKPKRQKFLVQASFKVFAGVEIDADTFNEAVSIANTMNEHDFFAFKKAVDNMDTETEITGIFKA